MTTLELVRPLAEKQARIKTIAETMNICKHLSIIGGQDMGSFSHEEARAFHDATDTLYYFIKLASAQT